MLSRKLLILFISGCAGIAEARFNHLDSDLVDPEERANTETYNDKISYRYPARWERAWRQTDVGYRVNAGSLNVSRFNFEDDIRVAPAPLNRFNAAFSRSRREDLVTQTESSEIRLGYSMAPGLRISLLGDADTLKEYGDMGMAVAALESPSSVLEFSAWSVDHYYQSKKSDEAASRDRDIRSYALVSRNSDNSLPLNWELRAESDSPFIWDTPARGYRYEYERRTFDGRASVVTAPGKLVYLSLNSEMKREGKSSLGDAATIRASKHMRRHALRSELGTEQTLGDGSEITAGGEWIKRQVDYTYDGTWIMSPSWQETNGPRAVRREEYGLFATVYSQARTDTGIQHGLFINRVDVREDAKNWNVYEIKSQFLVDFRLSPNTFFAINTTWDLDQIARDYPYGKKAPFRPWGGGDLQFFMTM